MRNNASFTLLACKDRAGNLAVFDLRPTSAAR